MGTWAGWLEKFPRYTAYDPAVPVYCVTPNLDRTIHRFFDTSPLSPCGRYLGLTRFPFEDRSPEVGDVAEVVIVDLAEGTDKVVATTTAWGSQLGAQVQWGRTADELFFNRMTGDWKPYGVVLDYCSGRERALDGTVYNVGSSGRWIVSPCLLRTGKTQLGYGVMAPPSVVPVNRGACDDDGVSVTDVCSGQSRMLVTIDGLVGQLPELQVSRYAGGDFYVFHTKWSPDESRIMVILRWTPTVKKSWWSKAKPASKKTMRKFVVTVAADGTDARIAISDEQWARGGHHPNWCPDSMHVMMNLNMGGDELRFVRVPVDGGQPELLHATAGGSGHPSLHPSGRYLLTDAYPGEAAGFGDGTVPIRLLGLESGHEMTLARIQSRPAYVGNRKEMRVDAHPAWDTSGNYIVFNACPGGTRQVFIADVSGLVAQGF